MIVDRCRSGFPAAIDQRVSMGWDRLHSRVSNQSIFDSLIARSSARANLPSISFVETTQNTQQFHGFGRFHTFHVPNRRTTDARVITGGIGRIVEFGVRNDKSSSKRTRGKKLDASLA